MLCLKTAAGFAKALKPLLQEENTYKIARRTETVMLSIKSGAASALPPFAAHLLDQFGIGGELGRDRLDQLQYALFLADIGARDARDNAWSASCRKR